MIPPLGTRVTPDWLEKEPPHHLMATAEPLIGNTESLPLRGSTITRPNALFAAKPPFVTSQFTPDKNGIEELIDSALFDDDKNLERGVLILFIGVTCIWLGAAAEFIRDKLKAHTTHPLRDAQMEANTTAPFRALDDIRDVVSFLRTNLVTAEDLRDTALATNYASWAMNALEATLASSEFAREKAGILSVLGEMFVFLDDPVQTDKTYNLLADLVARKDLVEVDLMRAEALAERFESFQNNSPASVKLKEWHERLSRIESRIREARETRRGKRK